MMIDVKVTEFPESVQEGTLVRWHKKQGDAVRANEKLADVETDKIVIEINASGTGTLASIAKKEGDILKRGDVIASIDSSGKAPAPAAPAPAAPIRTPTPAHNHNPVPPRSTPPSSPVKSPPPPPPAPVAAAPEPPPPPLDDLPPSVRKLIIENKINPKEISGSGRDGRVTKADVLRFLEHSPHLQTKFGDVAPVVEIAQPAAEAAPSDRPEQRVKMTRLRARIAERLVQAQHSAAILTTFNEVNMQAVMDLRARYKEQFEKEHGIKLGLMSFFVKAAVEALSKMPILNASVDGDEIVYKGYFDIGIAVSSPRGLIVPILRDADRLSLADIELKIADFAKRAEEGKLQLDELTGGTFTISNGGVFGSLLSTLIINPPQSAILGMHKIQKRPVAENDEVVIRPMMYLAVSYDHRIIDGRDAVLFLVAVKEAIEDPARLLLQI